VGTDDRFGRWRVERALHLGNWADVVIAREEGDGSPIALKRLHRHAVREPEAAKLFDAEAALAIALPPHPRLVHGLERGEEAGRPYVTMVLVDGADLRQASSGPIAPARAAAILIDACQALAHLHAHGVVHGDACPANLILGDDDRVTLCDLGVARPIGEPGPVRGTHAYMAPEQVRGEAWTPATDVFALGVVLWELVTGARLFFRGQSWLSMAAVIEAAPPPLRDDALDAIVRAALAKDAHARTPTPAALEAALRALADERGWKRVT
jgi:serine/threonine protein kinase